MKSIKLFVSLGLEKLSSLPKARQYFFKGKIENQVHLTESPVLFLLYLSWGLRR